MSPQELDALEQALSIKLPPAYRALLADYPGDLLEPCGSEDLYSTPAHIEHATRWLHRYADCADPALPKGCVAIGDNGAGDYCFLQPGQGDRVFIFLQESDEWQVEAEDLGTYLRKCRMLVHQWNLISKFTSDDPPSLLVGLEIPNLYSGGEEASVIFEALEVAGKVLQFDRSNQPINAEHATTRALQYLRSRLDPQFVVQPPFATWELPDPLGS